MGDGEAPGDAAGEPLADGLGDGDGDGVGSGGQPGLPGVSSTVWRTPVTVTSFAW